MLPKIPAFRHLLACGVLAIISTALLAQQAIKQPAPSLVVTNLGKGSVPLDGKWQFHLGDDEAWAAPGLDDSQWEQVTADKTLGLQGHASFEGFGWYRRHITLSPAEGASPDFALLIPAIDDVYELYWNGVLIGHLGTMPPQWTWYTAVPAQTYGLGPVRSGVLAVRVWKSPLFTVDDGTAGGFESVPMVGSPDAIAALKSKMDFDWLRRSQFRFGLTSLFGLVCVLSLVAWLRDRHQWLLFWMTIYSACLVSELFLAGMRLPYSNAILTMISQTEICIREISIWFLLLWLLQLQEDRKLSSLVRKAAIVSVIASAIDGLLILLYPWPFSALQMQIADAVLTPVMIAFEAIPAVLVAYAFIRRKQLDSARWAVAAAAFSNAMVYLVQNIAVQGPRFTHWTFGNTMVNPLFTLNGNPVNIIVILRTLLFISIVYAVIRFSIDERKRQGYLELEIQNARELQKVLVPETLPVVPGFTVTSAYRPAQQVGGDFFQIIPIEGGSTLVVLGDVSGKGLTAAMAVSLIVGAIRALADDYSQPAALLTQLNRRLFGRLQGGFATCLILLLKPDSACVMASAGHPAPYLNMREIEIPGALPLGIAQHTTYVQREIATWPGDHLALYTDGLLEARNRTGELYGFKRLEDLFSSDTNAAAATQAAVNFGQDDDITVLTLTRLAVGEESPAVQLASSLPL
jgi:hypothetical protein